MEEENIFTVQRPASHTDWETYHAIRKKNLFDPIDIVYDPNHPSLKDPKNHHYLFLMNGQIIGTLQLETLLNDTCIIRTLVIQDPYKKKGYGTLLLSLAEEITKEFECRHIHLHSFPNVVAFYEKSGYTRMSFPIDESTYPGTVDLGKVLQN